MPIYSKQDIVQITNGNVHPVLSYNAKMNPNSKSKKVLERETDPLNNLKRRFYKNSNKPIGQNKGISKDYYSKR
jgi:hypothetical protein